MEDYLESLPFRFNFLDENVPLGFSIWVCNIVPSIIGTIQSLKDQHAKCYKNDNDVMNVVNINHHYKVGGHDEGGFLSVLVCARYSSSLTSSSNLLI